MFQLLRRSTENAEDATTTVRGRWSTGREWEWSKRLELGNDVWVTSDLEGEGELQFRVFNPT